MTKTITRAYLAEVVYNEIGFSYAEASELVDVVFEEITQCLAEGYDVKLASFGSFRLYHKKERLGRNPKTKEVAIITARKVVAFVFSNLLKARINNNMDYILKNNNIDKGVKKVVLESKNKIATTV